MVCDRCILIVKQQLDHLGYSTEEISLGMVSIHPDPDSLQLKDISSAMEVLGFELIDREKDKLVEQIKTSIINLVHYSDLTALKKSITSMLADQLNRDYNYLSRLFSDAEGLTIEKYVIQQKIEKVKELLEYGELNLNEIAFRMGYSSSAHLSTQFKLLSGVSPSTYKNGHSGKRKSLDQLNPPAK